MIHPHLCDVKPNFYPRSPCGERHSAPVPRRPDADISIHALLAESDSSKIMILVFGLISIHALLAESDLLPATKPAQNLSFLSTLSLRRATGHCRLCTPRSGISIHALLAESDPLDFFPTIEYNISIHALLAESDG